MSSVDTDTERLEILRERPRVLARQNLRRNHERRLHPRLDRSEHRRPGDDRLPAPHVPLEKTVHPLVARKIACGCRPAPFLARAVSSKGSDSRNRFSSENSTESCPLGAAAASPETLDRKHELEKKELLELETEHRAVVFLSVSGEVDPAERVEPRGEVLPLDERLREVFVDRPRPSVERPRDELAEKTL